MTTTVDTLNIPLFLQLRLWYPADTCGAEVGLLGLHASKAA